MSRRLSMTMSLAIVGLLSAGVSSALAQPNPFQPLNPEAKKRPANTEAATPLVSPSHVVSVVVESAESQRQRERITAALGASATSIFTKLPSVMWSAFWSVSATYP